MAGPESTMRRTTEPAKLTATTGRHSPVCKPYLSITELAGLTPWTAQAIRTMISRGILREGQHFFYVGRRPVFKWEAVVAFIEQGRSRERVPHYRDQLSLWDENGKSADKPAPSR